MNPALPPPKLAGLSYEKKLGSGGYADVYLYQQEMPLRKVAVKVLRDALSPGVVARFTAEANAMARLEHPHIVPVYAADTTRDGRPYLVMMYYPRASLAERVRRERFGVAEVVRLGIQIGAAVETAHASGLLHRDIKPANILTSQYGIPGLTDFGIAAQVAEADDDDTGVSVPWSPPETLYATAPASVQSDVYALAATLWTLLVGRSPFEVTSGDNSQFALMKRIRDIPAPSTGRADVPTSLDRLLKTAMAKEPGIRPSSALDFVRSLQAVEQELRLPRTEVVLARDEISGLTSPRNLLPSDLTRVQGPARVVAQPPPGPAVPSVPSADAPSTIARPRAVTGRTGPDTDPQATVLRAVAGKVTPADSVPRRPVRRWAVVAGVAALVLVAGSVGVLLSLGTPARPAPTPTATAVDTPDVGVPAPAGLLVTGKRSGGKVVFRWDYQHRLENDSYRYRLDSGSEGTVTESTLTVPAKSAAKVCVNVHVQRFDGSSANTPWAKGCA